MRRLTTCSTLTLSMVLALGCGPAPAPPPAPPPVRAFVGVGSIVTPGSATRKPVWACAPRPGIRPKTAPATEKSDDAAAASTQITEAMRTFIASKPEYATKVKSFTASLSGSIETASLDDVATTYDALSPRCKDALRVQKEAGVNEFRIVTKLYHGMVRGKFEIEGPVQKTDRQAFLEKLEEEFSEQVWAARMGDDTLKSGGGLWVIESVPFPVP